MITTKKIALFESFNGDIDKFVRIGRVHEVTLFESDEWALLNSFYQDIELINKWLTSPSYTAVVMAQLKEKCDEESFEMLTNKINLYQVGNTRI